MAKKAINSADGESTSAYFRKVFEENPKLLKTRSNEELLQRWLDDHPGQKKVPENVKGRLSNVKSILRKRGRKRVKKQEEEQLRTTGRAPPYRKQTRGLDLLEEQIDECLTAARAMDREGLADVILLLRRARNAVVWKMGQ